MPHQLACDILKALWQKFVYKTGSPTKKNCGRLEPKARCRVKKFQSSLLGDKSMKKRNSLQSGLLTMSKGFIGFTVVEESIDNFKQILTALERANETANLKLKCSIDQLKTDLTQLQHERVRVLLEILKKEMEVQKKDVEELKKSGGGR
ncbi:hypothetical protein FNV43_RR15584 [Rhamnella rubrinervis]|uniref:Uncharacterized protein n=1 Tax=Rhamnella rubrinervis TaxID=2594499 RepID=A0A8K0GWW7_9ROSA|nr:hypothetical protein FNV43_RR15584 [Rhamnella rubrinervis]